MVDVLFVNEDLDRQRKILGLKVSERGICNPDSPSTWLLGDLCYVENTDHLSTKPLKLCKIMKIDDSEEGLFIAELSDENVKIGYYINMENVIYLGHESPNLEEINECPRVCFYSTEEDLWYVGDLINPSADDEHLVWLSHTSSDIRITNGTIDRDSLRELEINNPITVKVNLDQLFYIAFTC